MPSHSEPNANRDGTAGYTPLRSRRLHRKHVPAKATWRNWHRKVQWPMVTILILIPSLSLTLTPWVPLQLKTFIFSWVYFFGCGLGITAGRSSSSIRMPPLANSSGYHRLWSHRAYQASWVLRVCLAALGAGALQGSARWWSYMHRLHHRYTDTDNDPYSIRRGFFYAHMGWMILKRDPRHTGRTNITDLDADPIVVWQHLHIVKISLLMAYALPAIVCGLAWQDWEGGLLYGGIFRCFLLQQGTFCVNSVAHWLGEQPYDSDKSPRDNVLTALITLGEGYHNFHHEFPSDYRNAVYWYQYDPTKWIIAACQKVGLASHLQRFPQNAIDKGRVQQLQKRVDEERERLDWGVPIASLPIFEWDDFTRAAANECLLIISGVIYHVSDFADQHPGGRSIILDWTGKDATAAFHGGVYRHSNAAHNLLQEMRVGVIGGGGEVEARKEWTCGQTDASRNPLPTG